MNTLAISEVTGQTQVCQCGMTLYFVKESRKRLLVAHLSSRSSSRSEVQFYLGWLCAQTKEYISQPPLQLGKIFWPMKCKQKVLSGTSERILQRAEHLFAPSPLCHPVIKNVKAGAPAAILIHEVTLRLEGTH